MNRNDRILELIFKRMDKGLRHGAVVRCLAMVVVFVMTYLLILPAFTLDQETAAAQGGIDVPAAVQEEAVEEVQEETAAEEEAPAADEYVDQADSYDEYYEDESPADDENFSEADEATVDEAAEDEVLSELVYEGEGYRIAVTGGLEGLPADTVLAVTEIDRDSDEELYTAYEENAREAVKTESGARIAPEFAFARFYDIALISGGEEIEPSTPLEVTITYEKEIQKQLEAETADNVKVIHFAENTETEEVTPEILDSENVDVTINKNKMAETTFAADSFSVYAVVYTVDFHYGTEGATGELSIKGGDSISLGQLMEELGITSAKSRISILDMKDKKEKPSTASFLAEVESVEFSDPKLLWTGYLEEDCTPADIMTAEKLFVTYPLGLKQEEVLAINHKEYKAGDWLLMSLKPFTSEETLTITMKDGSEINILVTDAQDAVMNGDGTVQTIKNPAGTTIDLFDYWIIDPALAGRDGWGDLNQGWGGHADSQGLNGSGNNKGINSSSSDASHGHALKFSPAWEGTVYNGTKNGWTSLNSNGRDGLNSYTGGTAPFTGIVQDKLANGYPILTNNGTIGSNGESLAYLFDTSSQTGKASYPGVDQLLYVDRNGYYTFDSRDYKADFNKGSGTFKVTEQTSSDSEIRGFWPFGTQNFWMGMHVNTQFSMPAGGQVLNPAGVYKPMQFEFSGDDDVWIYVDGVLIGDAGGIHNRTEVDINFQTGKVIINGEEKGTIKEYFERAGVAGDYEWNGDTFANNTYHTFDFFYLERGGGESNLYIHYNLVSTADFTAHKSYEGLDAEDILERDQFKFELIGLDGLYRSVKNDATGKYELVQEDDTTHAIFPEKPEGGSGTVADPKFHRDDENSRSIYTTGCTEDGNINFGNAEINEQYMHDCDNGNPPVFKYMVREIIPEDAENADGVAWTDATDEQKAAGGFVKDGITYDGTVYYMTARVTSWTETSASGQTSIRYGLSKSYYTDDTYTEIAPDTSFINFSNKRVKQYGDIDFTKKDDNDAPLAGAKFALYTNAKCTEPLKIVVNGIEKSAEAVSGSNGKVEFTDIVAGTYYMKETEAPEGYALDESIYKVIIRDRTDKSARSVITLKGDELETPITEIINVKDGELSIEKKWLNSKGNEVSGENNIANVNLYRTIDDSEVPLAASTSVSFHREGASWDLDTGTPGNKVVIKDASAFDLRWHLGNSSSHVLKNMKVNGISVTKQGEFVDLGIAKVNWTPWDGSSSKLQVRDVKEDLNIEFDSNCDWFGTKPYTENVVPYTAPEIDTTPQFVEKLSMTSLNNWKQTLSVGGKLSDYAAHGYDLPKTDDNGLKYLYHVVELNGNNDEIAIDEECTGGYSLRGYSPNNEKGIPGQGRLTVYNQSETDSVVDLKIVKADADTGEALDGAVFKLLKLVGEGDDATFAAYSNEENGEDFFNGDDFRFEVSGENGVTIHGMTDGTYRLVEVSAPQGYIITEGEYEFTIENGAVLEGTPAALAEFTPASGDDPAEIRVLNEAGEPLPMTGGIGTKIFYMIGSVLIAGSAIILAARRRLAGF